LTYELYWDNGNQGNASIEVIEANLTTYVIQGLVPRGSYTFKVRASNIYGYGPFSSTVIIKTTDNPHVMDPVTTTQDNLNMVLYWTPPQTGGETIDKYQILIYIPSLDKYIEDMTYCDGSKDPFFS
jgi:hypothetical protein